MQGGIPLIAIIPIKPTDGSVASGLSREERVCVCVYMCVCLRTCVPFPHGECPVLAGRQQPPVPDERDVHVRSTLLGFTV